MYAEARARALAETKAVLSRFDSDALAESGPSETELRLDLLKRASPGLDVRAKVCRPLSPSDASD